MEKENLKDIELNKLIKQAIEESPDLLSAVNWNVDEDMLDVFWEQGISQFWVETEFHPGRDLADWKGLSEEEREAFTKILAGLTGLDTKQGGEGMPAIVLHEPNMKAKAVFAFMAGMEEIHARSYSYIFTTLISKEETSFLLDEWVEQNKNLTFKSTAIGYFYKRLISTEVSLLDLYMAKVASCYLESALFYSGFYYPLYLAGKGKMTQSGGIIYKITQDESYHGAVTGLTAQWMYEALSEEDKSTADKLVYELLELLFENEVQYTKDIYDSIGLTEDVIEYVKYNFNRALNNLGRENYFEPKPFNPIVLNQVNTEKMTNSDFFSTKADYVLSLNIEEINDSHIDFSTDEDSKLFQEFN